MVRFVHFSALQSTSHLLQHRRPLQSQPLQGTGWNQDLASNYSGCNSRLSLSFCQYWEWLEDSAMNWLLCKLSCSFKRCLVLNMLSTSIAKNNGKCKKLRNTIIHVGDLICKCYFRATFCYLFCFRRQSLICRVLLVLEVTKIKTIGKTTQFFPQTFSCSKTIYNLVA